MARRQIIASLIFLHNLSSFMQLISVLYTHVKHNIAELSKQEDWTFAVFVIFQNSDRELTNHKAIYSPPSNIKKSSRTLSGWILIRETIVEIKLTARWNGLMSAHVQFPSFTTPRACWDRKLIIYPFDVLATQRNLGNTICLLDVLSNPRIESGTTRSYTGKWKRKWLCFTKRKWNSRRKCHRPRERDVHQGYHTQSFPPS